MLLIIALLLAIALAAVSALLVSQRKASSELAGEMAALKAALDSAEAQIAQLHVQKSELGKPLAEGKEKGALAGETAALKASLDSAEAQIAQLHVQKSELEKSLAEGKEKAAKLELRIEDLKTAMNTNSFDGRFPICSKCKDIRDEKGCWHTMEEFIEGLSDAEFSHSLCPDCARELYPDMFEEGKKLHTLTWK